MEANQITVRLDDEEYVRSVWDKRLTLIDPAPGHWIINGFDGIYNGPVDSWPKTPEANWAAAAEFTRERLEQVRKVKLSALCLNHWGAISKGYPGQIEAFQYLTSLLNAELATLTRGMKPEALEGAAR